VARRAAGAAAVARSAARLAVLAAGVVRGHAALHHRRLRARRRRLPRRRGTTANFAAGGSAPRASPLAWRPRHVDGGARARWAAPRRSRQYARARAHARRRPASSRSAAWLRPYSWLVARAVGARASRGAPPTRFAAQRWHFRATPCALAEAAGTRSWHAGGRDFCQISTVPLFSSLLFLPPLSFFLFPCSTAQKLPYFSTQLIYSRY